MTTSAILSEIWVHPVKSCAGISVRESILTETGLEWDRTWMVVDAQGEMVTQRDVPAMALIENIQREDLNPLEEAQGIQRLISDFGFTHEQAAASVGRSRSAVSNLLRLLNLAKPVQAMLMAGDLDMGHARALLPLDGAHQITTATEIAAKKLSVREAEILLWVAQGKSNPEIALILDSSVGTVKKHMEHVLEKLGVDNRAAALNESVASPTWYRTVTMMIRRRSPKRGAI